MPTATISFYYAEMSEYVLFQKTFINTISDTLSKPDTFTKIPLLPSCHRSYSSLWVTFIMRRNIRIALCFFFFLRIAFRLFSSNMELEIGLRVPDRVRVPFIKPSLCALDNHLSHQFYTWSLLIFWARTGKTDSSGDLALNSVKSCTRTQSRIRTQI